MKNQKEIAEETQLFVIIFTITSFQVLHLMRERANICNQIHLPAQSGNNDILERMQRGYTREAYIDLVNHIRDILLGLSHINFVYVYIQLV